MDCRCADVRCGDFFWEVGLEEIEDVLHGKDHQKEYDDPPDGLLGRSLEVHHPANGAVQDPVQKGVPGADALRSRARRIHQKDVEERDHEEEGERIQPGEDEGGHHGRHEYRGVGPEVTEDPEVDLHRGSEAVRNRGDVGVE